LAGWLTVEVYAIDDANDYGLDGNAGVLEERPRGVALLDHEHLLAHADPDHVEGDDLCAFFSIVEIEAAHQQELFLAEVLVAVSGNDVTDDACEIHEFPSGCGAIADRHWGRIGRDIVGSQDLPASQVHPVDLPNDTRIHRREWVVESQSSFARCDEVNDFARANANSIHRNERPARVLPRSGDRLNPLQGDGG